MDKIMQRGQNKLNYGYKKLKYGQNNVSWIE